MKQLYPNPQAQEGPKKIREDSNENERPVRTGSKRSKYVQINTTPVDLRSRDNMVVKNMRKDVRQQQTHTASILEEDENKTRKTEHRETAEGSRKTHASHPYDPKVMTFKEGGGLDVCRSKESRADGEEACLLLVRMKSALSRGGCLRVT